MRNVLGAIAITAVALATTAAFAETANDEKNTRLATLWSQGKAETTSRATASVTNFTGVTSVLRFDTMGPWAGNHAAGRVHPPAGH